MPATKTAKPRLPAKIKRLGATKVQRTVGDSFSIGFTIDESVSHCDPGKGTAIVDALRAHFGAAEIKWGGRQCDAIIITLAA